MVGVNEKNTDTLILAVMDYEKKRINMFSIPRDLFFRKARINTIYKRYGAGLLTDTVSEITGVKVDRYILVEMYAFIDLVNVLGGIDITLDEELADPSYRVRDENGRWSTLYYPPGNYHLNGIEALRVARARHYTPLFSRDIRQQKILLALKDKFGSMGISDMNKIGSIIKICFKYVDTDLTGYEALSLFRDFRTIHDCRSSVLSTENVLCQTYSNLLHTGLKEEEVDENFDKGAWIVIPEENDWDKIKNFIREKIAE